MPYPAPTATSGYKVIWYFNCGEVAGWTEEFYWAGNTAGWEDVEADIQVLTVARQQVLTNKAELLGVRVAPWPNQDLASKLLAGPGASGFGRAPDDPAHPLPPWIASQVTISDRSHVYRREVLLRGLSRPSITWATDAFTGLSPVGRGQLKALLAVLRNDPLPASGTLRGVWCMDSQNKDPAVTGRTRVTSLAPNPSGCGTDVTTEGAPSWAVADYVKLHGMGQCDTRGLSGVSRVCEVSGDVTTIAQNAACCTVPYRSGPRATLEKVVDQLFAFAHVEAGAIRKRNTGRRFHRVSWAPCAWETPAVHPCGMVMDFLRSCYLMRMRTVEGEKATPGYWFHAEKTAKVFEDRTVFRSRLYTDPYRLWDGIGEQMDVCWDSGLHRDVIRCPAWYNCCVPVIYPGQAPCGAAETWQFGGLSGSTPPILTDGFGVPREGCEVSMDPAKVKMPSCPEIFPVQITAIAGAVDADGFWRYAWTEQSVDQATGGFVPLAQGRSGTLTANWMYEVNNDELTPPFYAWGRAHGYVGPDGSEQLTYEFEAPAPAPLTTEYLDGSSPKHGVKTLMFDPYVQVLLDEGLGQEGIAIKIAGLGVPGVIDLADGPGAYLTQFGETQYLGSGAKQVDYLILSGTAQTVDLDKDIFPVVVQFVVPSPFATASPPVAGPALRVGNGDQYMTMCSVVAQGLLAPGTYQGTAWGGAGTYYGFAGIVSADGTAGQWTAFLTFDSHYQLPGAPYDDSGDPTINVRTPGWVFSATGFATNIPDGGSASGYARADGVTTADGNFQGGILVGTPTGAPNGPAGGGLSGTYPNPSVSTVNGGTT